MTTDDAIKFLMSDTDMATGREATTPRLPPRQRPRLRRSKRANRRDR